MFAVVLESFYSLPCP